MLVSDAHASERAAGGNAPGSQDVERGLDPAPDVEQPQPQQQQQQQQRVKEKQHAGQSKDSACCCSYERNMYRMVSRLCSLSGARLTPNEQFERNFIIRRLRSEASYLVAIIFFLTWFAIYFALLVTSLSLFDDWNVLCSGVPQLECSQNDACLAVSAYMLALGVCGSFLFAFLTCMSCGLREVVKRSAYSNFQERLESRPMSRPRRRAFGGNAKPSEPRLDVQHVHLDAPLTEAKSACSDESSLPLPPSSVGQIAITSALDDFDDVEAPVTGPSLPDATDDLTRNDTLDREYASGSDDNHDDDTFVSGSRTLSAQTLVSSVDGEDEGDDSSGRAQILLSHQNDQTSDMQGSKRGGQGNEKNAHHDEYGGDEEEEEEEKDDRVPSPSQPALNGEMSGRDAPLDQQTPSTMVHEQGHDLLSPAGSTASSLPKSDLMAIGGHGSRVQRMPRPVFSRRSASSSNIGDAQSRLMLRRGASLNQLSQCSRQESGDFSVEEEDVDLFDDPFPFQTVDSGKRFVYRPFEHCSCARSAKCCGNWCPKWYEDPSQIVIHLGRERRFDTYCLVSWTQVGAQCCMFPWLVLIFTATIVVLARTNPSEFTDPEGVCSVTVNSTYAENYEENRVFHGRAVALTWFAVLCTWIVLSGFGIHALVKTAMSKFKESRWGMTMRS